MFPYGATLKRFAGSTAQSTIELVHMSHPRWPLPPTPEASPSNGCPLKLSVFDSSFNPPTMAHLALARLPFNPPAAPNSSSSLRAFDAKLLLFSIKNADKTSKPGDATASQRLEMMVLLARTLQDIGKQSGDLGSQNVAVAVCQEPTFVGKSATLKHFLHERLTTLSSLTTVQLTFLLGFDTLERLFAPRYYASESAMNDALRHFLSPSGDNCRIICARRAPGASYSEMHTSVLETAAEFVNSGSIVLSDIGEAERDMSSSEVRESIGNSDAWEPKVPAAIAAYIKENRLYKPA